MMHIFLTGEIQVGKSTVIMKALSLLNMPYGGFYTCFGSDRANPDRCLYIHNAAQPLAFTQHNAVVRFQGAFPPQTYSERFDTLGVNYLTEARQKSKLLVMDECGDLERDARAFQNEIRQMIDGDIPILGVIKRSAVGWVDIIRCHPRVRLLTVDRENRNIIPYLIADMIVNNQYART